MMQLSLPFWEIILRAVIVYFFLFLALRLTGKRQIGESSPFDFVLLLIIADGVQNSMSGGDESLPGGLITALTLFTMDHLVGIIGFKFKRVGTLLEGRPEVLIYKGQLNEDLVRRERLTRHEIEAAMRQEGCTTYEEVELAVLENNGSITIKKKEKK
ncbi:DUF421 domain-containing protein [Bdellovibrio sp. 22V]|uniref:DUF421 domain-containing protein n=1 Tax=Bdellovibrio TaxID=958 RepID=UPI002543022C|nr:YetF domain-containing protein [Bdellovibrio sp. 22V]WII73490.1 DUF421 domain-containing protein [Bdellovibrio sp. 22V]